MTERVVAVLSGGGAKGAAHVGAIKSLEEWNLTPRHFVGTSMGAVIAACFASGLNYEDVLQRVSALSRKDVAAFSPQMVLGALARSLLRRGPFVDTLATLVPARSFGDLEIPLTVTTVDAETGELVLFGEGGRTDAPLLDVLYASCALPVYYPPGRIGDREYIDGGVRSVLPLHVAERFDPTLVFAVSVGPSLERVSPPGFGSEGIVGAHRRALRIMMAVQTTQAIARWHRDPPAELVLVRPNLEGSGTFAVDQVVEYVEDGYRAAHRALNVWRQGR